MPASLERILDARGATRVRIAPDESWLCYVTDVTGTPQLWRVSTAGGMPRRLTFECDRVGAYRISPDGTRVAYATDSGGNEKWQLWLMDADGANARPLTDREDRIHHLRAWTDDGRSLLVLANTRDARFFDLWSFPADDGVPRMLYQRDGTGFNATPLPDGGVVVQTNRRRGDENDLILVSPDGGSRTLTPDQPAALHSVVAAVPGGLIVRSDRGRDFAGLATLKLDGTFRWLLTPEHDIEDGERFGRLCREAGVRGQWPGMPMNVRDDDRRPLVWEAHRRMQAGGSDFWPVVAFKPLAPFFGFERSIVFQRVPAWNEVLNGPDDAKLRTLADPAWRDRARTDWDNRTHSTQSRIDRPHEMLLAESETGAGPVDLSLADYAARRGLHISDALAEWVLANGVRSIMVGTPEKLSEPDIVAAIREPRTLANVNDSGAHLQLFSGAGEHMYLLTHYVREAGLLSVEAAVHALTGRTAAFFGLSDRGVVAPGKVGDLAVFALDEIELRREERRYDVPHGTWRFTRPPAGFRATVVAGTPTWLDGHDTGTRPGTVLRPVA